MLNLKGMDKIYNMCRALAEIKNKDYGTKSLYLFDGLSILVRMNDKIMRLNNFFKNKELFVNETIQDTILDLINYSFYLLLYLNGDLEADGHK